MKRLQTVLCAVLLTVALSSAASAGSITTLAPGSITTKPGSITTKPGSITTAPGSITTWSVVQSILSLVSVIG